MKLIKRALALVAVFTLLLTGCTPAVPSMSDPTEPSEPAQLAIPSTPSPEPPSSPTSPQAPEQTLVPLSAAWKQQVENDWYTTTGTDLGDWENIVEDTEGIRYYGTYSGYDILFVPGNGEAETQLEIENMTFEYQNTFEIYAYREGDFTPIKKLSTQGKLTRGNLVELLAVHRSYGRTSTGERTPVLTMDTLGMMKVAFLKAYNLTEKYTLAQLSVAYYGQYGEAHVGFINCDGMAYTQAVTNDTIDGVTFRYPTGQKLQVVHEGKLLSLREAFDQGLLTREDLVAIRNQLNPQNEDNLVTE